MLNTKVFLASQTMKLCLNIHLNRGQQPPALAHCLKPLFPLQKQKGEAMGSLQISRSGHTVDHGSCCPRALCDRKGGTTLDGKDLQPWQMLVMGIVRSGIQTVQSETSDQTPPARSPRQSSRPQRGCRSQARPWHPLQELVGLGWAFLLTQGREETSAELKPTLGAAGLGALAKAGRSCGQEGPDPKSCLHGSALPCPKAQAPHTEVTLGIVQTSCRLRSSPLHCSHPRL